MGIDASSEAILRQVRIVRSLPRRYVFSGHRNDGSCHPGIARTPCHCQSVNGATARRTMIEDGGKYGAQPIGTLPPALAQPLKLPKLWGDLAVPARSRSPLSTTLVKSADTRYTPCRGHRNIC